MYGIIWVYVYLCEERTSLKKMADGQYCIASAL